MAVDLEDSGTGEVVEATVIKGMLSASRVNGLRPSEPYCSHTENLTVWRLLPVLSEALFINRFSIDCQVGSRVEPLEAECVLFTLMPVVEMPLNAFGFTDKLMDYVRCLAACGIARN